MVKIEKLTKYSPEIAEGVRGLLIELSRSGRDGGEVPKEWFEELIESYAHDMLLATENGKLLGMLTVSKLMGPGIRRHAYLEDFVVSTEARGKGVGSLLWEALLVWGKEKNCDRLEFTSGADRVSAQQFYQKMGAEIYKTNFFRKEI